MKLDWKDSLRFIFYTIKEHGPKLLWSFLLLVQQYGRQYWRRKWVWIPVVLLLLYWVSTRWIEPGVWRMLMDEESIQAFVQQLGWFGPIALILFNAVQIILAPIPGYMVQAMAGFLYGPWWGGLWATFGLLIGSTTAMWLARRFGRPLVERMVSSTQIEKWEKITFSTNSWVWVLLLLGPTGDFPYYLAGLSHVRFKTILLITFCIRVPSVFVSAAAGSGIIFLTWWHLAVIVLTFAVLAAIFWRYQDRLLHWFYEIVQRRALQTTGKLAVPNHEQTS